MLRRTLALAALTALLGTARAGSVLDVVEQAAEVAFPHVDWPAGETGTLRYTLCSGCPLKTTRLSAETRYLVDHQPVSFAELVAAVELMQASQATANRTVVGLFFDSTTQRLVKISL